jgi:hypothetical protein
MARAPDGARFSVLTDSANTGKLLAELITSDGSLAVAG